VKPAELVERLLDEGEKTWFPPMGTVDLGNGYVAKPMATSYTWQHPYEVADSAGNVVGKFIAIASTKKHWYPDVSLAPETRGKGLFKAFLRAASAHYPVFTSDVEGFTTSPAEGAWKSLGGTRKKFRTPDGQADLWTLKESDGEPLDVIAYRVGELDDFHGRGIYFSLDKEGAESYASLHPEKAVLAYRLRLNNVLRARHQNDVIQRFFKKTYGQFHDHHNHRLRDGVKAGRHVDGLIMREVKKAGYDGIFYSNPAPPAKQEVGIFDQRYAELIDKVEA
jgi:hypothetical protein